MYPLTFVSLFLSINYVVGSQLPRCLFTARTPAGCFCRYSNGTELCVTRYNNKNLTFTYNNDNYVVDHFFDGCRVDRKNPHATYVFRGSFRCNGGEVVGFCNPGEDLACCTRADCDSCAAFDKCSDATTQSSTATTSSTSSPTTVSAVETSTSASATAWHTTTFFSQTTSADVLSSSGRSFAREGESSGPVSTNHPSTESQVVSVNNTSVAGQGISTALVRVVTDASISKLPLILAYPAVFCWG